MRPTQILLPAFVLISFVSCKKIERPVLPVVRYEHIGSIPGSADIYSNDHIAFFDASNGVVAGYNHFNVTHDGGKTWTSPITFPTNSNFVGLSIIGSSCYAFMSGTTSGKIYRSNDNGTSWQVISNTSDCSIGFYLTPSLAYKSVWLGSEYGIERSLDGGLNWSNVSLPVPQSQFELQQFYFVDANTGYVISRINNRIYTTTDGGATWSQQQGGHETFKIEVLGNRIFHAHSTYSSDYITYSDNCFQTWNTVGFDNSFNPENVNSIENISFSADGNLGCALGNYNLLYLSTDRGLTWKFHLDENGSISHNELNLENIKILPGGKILGFTREREVYELIWQK